MTPPPGGPQAVTDTEDAAPPAPVPTRASSSTTRAVVSTLIVTVVLLATVLALAPLSPAVAGWIIAAVAVLFLMKRLVFNWTGALLGLAAVVMFVPVRRFALPIPLPFALEPYRVMIVLIAVAVIVALLIDPKFTWQKPQFTAPIGFFLLTMVISVAARAGYISNSGLGGGVIGAFANFLLIFAVFFSVRQLLRTQRMVTILVTFLVWAGAVVGFFSLFERVTKINVFLMLDRFLPLIKLREDSEAVRAGGGRAFGSSQHPIALAVVMVILIPLALYLAKYALYPRNEINRQVIYGIATLMLLAGVVAAVSRTAIVALGVMFILTLIFRPKIAGVVLLLITPFVFIAYALTPTTINSTLGAFLDIDALIASQYTSAGWTGAGRLADLEPAMREVRVNPFFGTGVGTRIAVGESANAYILDNQFLGTLLEAGAVGVLGLLVLFLVPPIRMLVFSFRPGVSTRASALTFALSISGAGYFTALFFFDAFNFIQAFLLIFILFAIGAAVMTNEKMTTEEMTTDESGLTTPPELTSQPELATAVSATAVPATSRSHRARSRNSHR